MSRGPGWRSARPSTNRALDRRDDQRRESLRPRAALLDTLIASARSSVTTLDRLNSLPGMCGCGADVAPRTGWHKHPGPVFILVTKGELTYYDYDDPECNGIRVPAGEGFVDDGHGHRVRNENGAPAEDISVIMAPPTGPFRSDLDPALSGCGS